MSNNDEGAEVPQRFGHDEVVYAEFALERVEADEEVRLDLFLRSYRNVDVSDKPWEPFPREQWPRIAVVKRHSITMFPIHTNPHAARYLSPKNGRFSTVIYLANDTVDLTSNDPEKVAMDIVLRLPHGLFDPPGNGLGLARELDFVWQGLSRLQSVNVLVVSTHPEFSFKGEVVCISTDALDKLRRHFNRVTKKGRDLIRHAKQRIVHDDLLTHLDPERFERLVQLDQPLVEYGRESRLKGHSRERAERLVNVQRVRRQVEQLANEAPFELRKLHAEIELVTLQKMIEDFELNLAGKFKEPHWQNFFEKNKFVLSLAFARPVQLTHTQFHARPSGLDGSGAQIGDFLFKELGQALAIVEIKTPETDLVQGSAYRGKDVFGPNSELSGAITQVLFQQSELRHAWGMHSRRDNALRESEADVIKCVVVAGRLPTVSAKLRSFEVFRNACKDVEILTFDELLAKLKFLAKYLASEVAPSAPTATQGSSHVKSESM